MRCWRWLSSRQERPLAGASRQDHLPGTWEVHARYIGLPGIAAPWHPGHLRVPKTCATRRIFVGDATHAVMPPDPEMLTAALLLLAAGRARRQAAES